MTRLLVVLGVWSIAAVSAKESIDPLCDLFYRLQSKNRETFISSFEMDMAVYYGPLTITEISGRTPDRLENRERERLFHLFHEPKRIFGDQVGNFNLLAKPLTCGDRPIGFYFKQESIILESDGGYHYLLFRCRKKHSKTCKIYHVILYGPSPE